MNLRRRLAGCSLALLALCSGLHAVAGNRPVAALKAGTFDPPRLAPVLRLASSNGGGLSLADYRGKVVLLEFGFSNCPNVCPMTLAVLAQARKQLGADARHVQVVFVTVDPERDTARQLRAYLGGFDRSFVGATGTPAQLAAAREAYGVMAKRKDIGDGYTVGHYSSVYLIDREGRLRAMMPYGRQAGDYVHDLRILLHE